MSKNETMEWIPVFEVQDESNRQVIVKYECSYCSWYSFRQYGYCPHCKRKWEEKAEDL